MMWMGGGVVLRGGSVEWVFLWWRLDWSGVTNFFFGGLVVVSDSGSG